MKSKLIVGVLIASFVFAGASYAQELSKKEEVRGSISSSSTVTEEVSPDTVQIVLAVKTTAKKVKEAAQLNNQAAEKVINSIKNLINQQAGDTIKTSSYSVQPDYAYDKGKSWLTGYTVTNEVTVTTKQIKNAGNIIDTAVENGANSVSSINFTVSENKELCRKMLVRAAEAAKSDANAVAGALGAKLGGVKYVSMSCSSQTPSPIYRGAYLMEAKAAESVAAPVEAGNIKVQSTVSTEFFLDK